MIDMTQVKPQETRPQQPQIQPGMPYIEGYQPPVQPQTGGYTTQGTAQGQGGGQPPVWQQYGQGPKPKQWTQWPEDVSQYAGQAGNWYRDPSWPAHLVWNKRTGFQNYRDVLEQMRGGQPIGQWDLTPHMDWWEEYNIADWGLDPSLVGANKFGGGAGGGSDWTGNWMDYFTQPQGNWNQGFIPGFTMPATPGQGGGYSIPEGPGGGMPFGSQPMGPSYIEGPGGQGGAMPGGQTGTQGPGGFQYPWQWGQASDVYSRFAQGLPTSTEDWWSAQQAPFERTIEDQTKALAEQMGLGGLRYSTPMGYGIADIVGRESGNLYAQLAANQLGLTESAKDRAMMAAGGLTGLGGQYLQAPQDYAQRLFQMGAGMTGLGQSALDRAYQDWLRTTFENNPMLAQSMGYAGMQSQVAPQQYQQGWLGQLMNALTGGLGMAAGLGWQPLQR